MISKVNFVGVAHDYRGKSTDVKPILSAENNGATYYEMDTLNVFMWDGDLLEWTFQLSLTALFPKPPAPPDEWLELTINSWHDKKFTLPTSGRVNDTDNPYAWIVDWGDGTVENCTGTGKVESGIQHTYPNSNTVYTVVIRPQNPNEAGWLRAFGFSGEMMGFTGRDRVVSVNGVLTENMIRVGATDTNVCAYWFNGCTNLTAITLSLPQTITAVGERFAYSMFADCIALKTGAVQFFGNLVLPQAELEKTEVYEATFASCIGISESLKNIPQLQQVPGSRKFTFYTVPAADSLVLNWK